MQNRYLTQFLGSLYKKHGMTVAYLEGYQGLYESCKFMCAKHGEFVAIPYNVVHNGVKTTNSCDECASENRSKVSRHKKLYNVGINDWDRVVSISSSQKIPEYKLWKDLLKRVYSEVYHRKNPTYAGTSLDNRWLSLTAFIEDVSKLPNYEKGLNSGWALDKDIIVNGNKHYSLETCCFVPPEVNCNFKQLNKGNGLPIGVYLKKGNGKFACDCKSMEKTVYLGVYDTAEEAFEVRKKFKQSVMKELADKYREVLDYRVIHKLDNFDYDYNGFIITKDI